MIEEKTMEKLAILAESAKYDVSCASSGVERKGKKGGLGSGAKAGICHTWASDGRCVSLLKVLMSNRCAYNCTYCCNRISNDFPRAAFEPEELAQLTIEFYRRNYIEGLFLSSAVDGSPDRTMERMIEVISLLRNKYNFWGYIHMKGIPGADQRLLIKAGYLADRISVNLELPSKKSLAILAPQKKIESIINPMIMVKNHKRLLGDGKTEKLAPAFVPAGQSTQMIIGASPESDREILLTTQRLYNQFDLKRVYFSAYIPVNDDKKLPSLMTQPPLLREHRLYQCDWLLRFYHFDAKEILNEDNPNLDVDFDPKMNWAINHPALFPMEINRVSYKNLLRIPGVGVKSARRIMSQRKTGDIRYQNLKDIGVVLKRAKYFLTCNGKYYGDVDVSDVSAATLKKALSMTQTYEQMSLFH
jgi:putative DNA modification/repair radical SAM protein